MVCRSCLVICLLLYMPYVSHVADTCYTKHHLPIKHVKNIQARQVKNTATGVSRPRLANYRNVAYRPLGHQVLLVHHAVIIVIRRLLCLNPHPLTKSTTVLYHLFLFRPRHLQQQRSSIALYLRNRAFDAFDLRRAQADTDPFLQRLHPLPLASQLLHQHLFAILHS